MKRNGLLVALLLVALLLAGGAVVAIQLEDGTGEPEQPITFEEVDSERGFEYATESQDFGNGDEGVFVADYNNDNWPDVLVTGGDHVALYTNTGGEFEQSNALPEISIPVKTALFFDYDNDGWDDLLLLPVNGSATFLENRRGDFVKTDVGFDGQFDIASAASAADYTGNGCLDVFVTQNGDWRDDMPARTDPSTEELTVENGSVDIDIDEDNGNPNLLFAGNCSGFHRVSDAGIEGTRWSVATSFVDLTGNGHPDIHVANDYNHDRLYRNLGNGTFVSSRLSDTNRHGMASEIADVNRDGAPDVFVTNIHFEHENSVLELQRIPNMDNTGNSLLVNQGSGSFAAMERKYGVKNGSWGWAAALVDLDNDGDRDLIHSTKYHMNTSESSAVPYQVTTTPRLWERTPDRFESRNASLAGFAPTDGRGLAHLDYDRDGDQDIVVATASGPFKLYENTGATGHWLQIELRSDGQRPVVGTEIEVVADDRTRHVYANSKADFLSQDTRVHHVGLGTHESVHVRVRWPDGRTLELENVSANQRLVVRPDGTVRQPER